MKKEKNTETNTYIIDGEYRLQYVCENLAKTFPDLKTGDICYEKFRGSEKPCRNCPLAHKKRKTDMFYNEDEQKWLKINAGEIEWPGASDCHVILTRDITEQDMDELCRFVNMKKEIVERRNSCKDETNKLTGLFPREPFLPRQKPFFM